MTNKSPYGFIENEESIKIQLECFRMFPLGKLFLLEFKLHFPSIPIRIIETQDGKRISGVITREILKKYKIKSHKEVSTINNYFKSELERLLFTKLSCVYFWNIIKKTLGFDDESNDAKFNNYINQSELFLERAWFEKKNKCNKYITEINKKFFSSYPHLSNTELQSNIVTYFPLFIENASRITSNYYCKLLQIKNYKVGQLQDDVNSINRSLKDRLQNDDKKAILQSKSKLKLFIVENPDKSSKELAKLLRVSRSTLFSKAKHYGLKISNKHYKKINI